MEKQDEAHIGFESGAPAEVQWSEESFVRPVEPDERRSLRLYDWLIKLAILICTLLILALLGIVVASDVYNKPGVEVELGIILVLLSFLLVMCLAHGHALKFLFIRKVRARRASQFEPSWDCIFVEIRETEDGKIRKGARNDFGLLRLRPGYMEIEMQNHRARLSAKDIAILPGKGWESCGDRVRIRCGEESLSWEVTLLPFFQGVNIGVFGTAIIGYRRFLKQIKEGISEYKRYTFNFRKAVIAGVAFLGLMHSAITLLAWATVIVAFTFMGEWLLLGMAAHGIPALLLFIGFLLAYIFARTRKRCASYFLAWSVLASAIFFVYDVTNQNHLMRDYERRPYFYVNWPLYRGSVNTWRTGCIDRNGEYIIRNAPRWGRFLEGLSPVEVDDKRGFINKSGEHVISPRFEIAHGFSESLAMVSMENKCGYIDKAGKFVIEPTFDWANNFSEGLVAVQINGEWGYINNTGVFEVEPLFRFAEDFSEGLAAVEVDSKWGFIDRHGGVIVEPQYDRVREFREGLAAVKVDDKWGYVGKLGESAIEPVFEWGGGFSGGLAQVGIGDKYGYLDTSGEVAVSARFDDCKTFSEGLASVRIDDKYGYIDNSGNFVIEPQFRMASVFRDGLALVSVIKRFGYEKKWGYINTSGEFVIKPVFYNASRFSDGVAWVRTIDGLGRGVTYGLVGGLGVIVFGVYWYRARGKRTRRETPD